MGEGGLHTHTPRPLPPRITQRPNGRNKRHNKKSGRRRKRKHPPLTPPATPRRSQEKSKKTCAKGEEKKSKFEFFVQGQDSSACLIVVPEEKGAAQAYRREDIKCLLLWLKPGFWCWYLICVHIHTSFVCVCVGEAVCVYTDFFMPCTSSFPATPPPLAITLVLPSSSFFLFFPFLFGRRGLVVPFCLTGCQRTHIYGQPADIAAHVQGRAVHKLGWE